ncbi:glycosyltransferase [Clostridium oceanicum]|uniref:Glycosyltransferase n=1 Tax=Clostridium oceanicum TaxID=1543 RepID=A0ABP3UJC4_9CLOT
MEMRKKLVFFIIPGGDAFIDDIINNLSNEYETKKVIVKTYEQINKWMKWADICWFEWCDWIVIHGSKQEIAKEKKIICRIHGYEVYTNNILRTKWENVDQLIIVAPHVRRIFEEKTKNLYKGNLKIETVFCGINTTLYPFKKRKKGFNIGYLGFMDFKKNIPLTLDIFKKLHDMDSRYKLHLAGKFKDGRTYEYYKYFIKYNKLEKDVLFYGWRNFHQKIEWLKKIQYILISSIDEGLCFAAAESMCSGIKPIIHNCEGLKDHYNEKYIFDNIDEAVKMITSDEYNSNEYRKFIEDNYSSAREKQEILKLLKNLIKKPEKHSEKNPLVTVGITNYNYINFLDECLNSVLNQDYNNIEILIVDDCSTDGSIEKIKEYEQKYKNIKAIYHSKNSGNPNLSMKEIIEIAKGEYFFILSTDDFLYDNNVISKHVYSFLNDKTLDCVYGNTQTVDCKSNKKAVWRSIQFNNDEVICKTFQKMGSGVIPFCRAMFKKDFFIKNKLKFIYDPDNVVGLDTLNTLVYVKYGFKRNIINCNTTCYRLHENNLTYNIKGRIKSIISAMEYIVNNFDEKIYIPEIQWDKYDTNKRKSIKMYKIGKHYFNTAMVYYNKNIRLLNRCICLEQEQIKEYIQPLILLSQKYLDKSITESEMYTKEIKILKAQIDSMKIY